MNLKLNGGRTVTGILRGFDPFMNVVIDDTVEECKDGTRNNIGMVVGINRFRNWRFELNKGTNVLRSTSLGHSWQQHYHGGGSGQDIGADNFLILYL